MRQFAIVLLFSSLPIGAFAQTKEADVPCRAPVSVEDRACADALRAGAPGDRQGSMEQRDDGYYVFVPRARD